MTSKRGGYRLASGPSIYSKEKYMSELDILFPIPSGGRNADDMGMPPPLKPEDYGLPPYPDGEVVGPCVCGSWPGGKCFKCKVVVPPNFTVKEKSES